MSIKKRGALNRVKKEKSSVYSFFLLSYTLILLVSLSSCLFFGLEVAQQLRREDALSKQALLTSLKNDVEENLRTVEELGNRLVFNQKLQFLVSQPSLSSMRDAMQEMSSKTMQRDFLLDYFLYVRSEDMVLTSTIRMDAEKFFDIIYEFTDLTADQLRQGYLQEYHFQQYLPACGLRQYDSDEVIRVIPYMQSIPISSSAPPPGQLMILLDREKLFAQARQLHDASNSAVYILDKAGALVYASADAPELPTAVQESADALVSAAGTAYTRFVSEETGWTYLISTPANLYFTKNLSTVVFLVGVFAVYLLLGLFLVRRIAQRSYRPVKDINDLILQSAEAGGGQNEFDVIKSTLLSQMRSGTELQRIVEAQRPAVLRDLLLQLLLGQTTDWDGAKTQLESLGVHLSGDRFLVVLVETDLDSAFFLGSDIPLENNLSVARLVLQNVGCELLGETLGCQYLDLGRAQGVFLLCLPSAIEAGQALETVQRQSGSLARFCAQQFELDVRIGVSTAERGLDQLPLRYDEARKALEYSRLLAGEETTPVLFGALDATHSDYYYPLEAEQQLLQLIRTGEATRAQEALDRIFKVNFETKRISTTAARTLLYQLAATLQRLSDSDALAQGGGADFDERMVEQVVNSSSIDYARRRLAGRIVQLAAAHENRVQSKTEKLVERIVDYIDHCAEDEYPDLTLLSDEFGVTPQYISNVFKKYRDENVKDYIARRKLAQAKTLLAHTDLSVREIAARLGYAGEIGIIRLFRKYENTTPGDYRARHR